MNKKKKIAIVGTNGLPGRYGGWDQLVNHLTANLRDEFDFIVYTSKWDAVDGIREYNGAKIKVVPLSANGVQSIFFDAWSIVLAMFQCNVIAVFGTSGCIFLPLLRLFGANVVLNPDGAEWKRGKWGAGAKAFLRLSEKLGVKYSKQVVADNVHIVNSLFEDYGVPSSLIEYGGDNAKYVELTKAVKAKYNIEAQQYAFKVCRIEPENNIDLILEAFERVDYRLIMIGNWANSSYGQAIKKKFEDVENISLLDPIYEQETLDELRGNCGIYVHGHSVGGTNPSLVEAMSLRLFCLVFDVNYNRETTEGKAVYFKTREELVDLLTTFIASNNNEEVKDSMLEIATRRYKWEIITEKYAEVFRAA